MVVTGMAAGMSMQRRDRFHRAIAGLRFTGLFVVMFESAGTRMRFGHRVALGVVFVLSRRMLMRVIVQSLRSNRRQTVSGQRGPGRNAEAKCRHCAGFK